MKIGYLMQAGVPDLRRHPFSGPANHVRYVVAELRRRGHHLCLLAVFDNQIWKSEDLSTFEPVTVRRVDQGIFQLFERGVRRIQDSLTLPYAALFESLRFALACRQELAGYDLLYERMGWFGYGGGLAARWLHVPWILEVNGDHLSELEMRRMPPAGVQRWLSVALTKKAVGSTSCVVAAGEGLRKTFIDRWRVDPEKVAVVENGSELVSLLDRSQLRSFHPPPALAGATTVVFLGGFDPWQGTSILVRAVAMGIARGVPLKLLLVGSGPGREETERLVREHRLDDFVTFAGQLAPDQYAGLLAQADIGVSPYCGRTEYVGMKLIDYKAAALAIIASGENNQPSLIEHGRTGWIVPPCDVTALCDAILHLASDVELRSQMGRAARIEAEELHGWGRTGQRLNEIFSNAIQEHRDRGIRTEAEMSPRPPRGLRPSGGSAGRSPLDRSDLHPIRRARSQGSCVSVVIPTYNHARYLGEAIHSALNQTYQDREIIVVDDGSTDNTPALVASFGAAVLYVRQENRGLAAARNAGILAARGEIVGFLDADDLWLPEYLATMLPALRNDTTVGAVYCGWQYIDSAGTALPRTNIRVLPRGEMYEAMTFMDFLIPSGVLVRRECFERLGLFDETLLTGCEDSDMWIRLLATYAMVGVAQALVKYRTHGDNMSADLARLEHARHAVVAKHFGTDERKNPAHRRAYGGLYLSSAYAYLERGYNEKARESLQRAFAVYPEMTTDVDTFYQLAVADQPVGSRGVFEHRNLESSATTLLANLDAVFASRSCPAEIEPYRRHAYANAHLALGLLAYGCGKPKLSRRYLLKALRGQPSLLAERQLLPTLLRTCLGRSLIANLRHHRARLVSS